MMGAPTQKNVDQEDYDAAISEAADRLKYQVEFAQTSIKNLLIVNGGAILSLLTLIGNYTSKFDSRGIWWSFFWFGLGMIAALASYFGAFLSQYYFMQATYHEAWNAQRRSRSLSDKYDVVDLHRSGNSSFAIAASCAVLSLASFILGAFIALNAIL